MTRTLTAIEGFDWFNTPSDVFDVNGNTYTESQARYANGRSLQIDTTADSWVQIPLNHDSASGTIGVAINTHVIPGTDNLEIIRLHPQNNLSLIILAGSDVLGVIDADNNVLGTSTSVITLDTWHYIEWQYILENSITEAMTVKVDNSVVITINAATDTKSASASSSISGTRLYNGHTGLIMFDDFYRTTYNHGYLGAIRIAALYASSDNLAQWQGSDGDSINNYQLIDETGVFDEDATYVLTTGVNKVDLYEMDDLPAAATSVKGIEIITRGRKSGSDTATFSQAYNSASTQNLFPSISLGDSYAYHRTTTGLNPDTSAAFTISEINAIIIGQKSLTFG